MRIFPGKALIMSGLQSVKNGKFPLKSRNFLENRRFFMRKRNFSALRSKSLKEPRPEMLFILPPHFVFSKPHMPNFGLRVFSRIMFRALLAFVAVFSVHAKVKPRVITLEEAYERTLATDQTIA